ncbi:MAG: hypothetical protein LBC46_02305 [Treponema sp.]|nr:hypothetical protein [Treponema sp.]
MITKLDRQNFTFFTPLAATPSLAPPPPATTRSLAPPLAAIASLVPPRR